MTPATVLDESTRDRLAARYREPPRHHHTLAHAGTVAAHVSWLGGDRACLLAAWFHDAVYEPLAPDNERRSAELLLAWLADDPDAARAAALVRTTATHTPPPGDRQAAILCDADLAVLGADPSAYEAYRRAVRREFAALDDRTWAAGRADVLRDLLGRDVLFHTARGRERWEAAARRNLAAELATLGRGGGEEGGRKTGQG